jgi:hypothetical protein
MQISLADWIVIFGYFALHPGIAFYYHRRSSEEISEFLVSGRYVHRRLAGTSAGRDPDEIGIQGQTHISGKNGRLACQ